MSVQPEFDTVSEADSVYYSSSGDDGGDGSDSGAWGELQSKPTDWVAGWTLGYQEHQTDTGRRRWFDFRVNPETEEFEALTMSGSARTFPDDATLDELPHAEEEQRARDAYEAWVRANPDAEQDGEQDGDGGTEWTEWTQLNQVAGWTIWGREAKNGDQVQFLAAGKLDDGSTVYLQPDGTTGDSPHIYKSQSELQEALDAWQSRVDSGEVSEDQRPNGNSPTRGEITEDARSAGADGQGTGQIPGPLSGAVQAVGGRRNALIVAAVGGVALIWVAEEYGYLDLGLQDTVAEISGGFTNG
jgi:hypothetical protein